jgi:hypothetical protein
MTRLLNDNSDDLLALCCELIGTCAQNNPYCQEKFLKLNYLDSLFKVLEEKSDVVRVKALFAISCNYINSNRLNLFIINDSTLFFFKLI